MGCITSKLLSSVDLPTIAGATSIAAAGELPNHTVSLTSSTYGILDIDPFQTKNQKPSPPLEKQRPFRSSSSQPSLEIINWELVEDPEDSGITACSPAKKRSAQSQALFTPSPGKFSGKGNITPRRRRPPLAVLKPLNKTPQSRNSGSERSCCRSRSLSPLFDPDLVASFEQELGKEAASIKQGLPTIRRKRASEAKSLLFSFESKCPPGGEDAVVLYTTTLRGIRKTYEDCNLVRSIIESYNARLIEKDISMDSGFREELRKLVGKKEARPPVLFVKGRMIGGAAEVTRLEEDDRMTLLMEGIPPARWCDDCRGVRFVVCKGCDGSCKVLDEEGRKKMKCGECNENGLVLCHSCSSHRD